MDDEEIIKETLECCDYAERYNVERRLKQAIFLSRRDERERILSDEKMKAVITEIILHSRDLGCPRTKELRSKIFSGRSERWLEGAKEAVKKILKGE